MTQEITGYPLSWPAGWQRTSNRAIGRFGSAHDHQYGYRTKKPITVAVAVERIIAELGRMGIPDWNVIVSTNLEVRLSDGLPKSRQREPDDPGAAVYWRDDNDNRRCMAIDRYTKVEQNLAAIAATLEAMRAIERHGGAEILDRAFTAFTALPDLSSVPWFHVLGYGSEDEARADDWERRARQLMQEHHPDKGGDEWRFKQIAKALAEARERAAAA